MNFSRHSDYVIVEMWVAILSSLGVLRGFLDAPLESSQWLRYTLVAYS